MRGLRIGRRSQVLCVGAMAMLWCCCCHAQVRVAQWNITNYSSGRVPEFQTAIYGTFESRSLSPDVLVVQELVNASGRTNFLALLNTAPGSPGDWAAAPFVVNSGDTNNGLFYRTSRVNWIDTVTLNANTGSGATQPPRDNQRYRIRLFGYASPGAELYLYASHMKAGSTGTDQNRRTTEANRLRGDANTLPAGANFILCGDLNIQNSAQQAYQILTEFDASATGQPIATASGRFFDPINTPGDWNNDSAFRFVHTQDPATESPGGMDDRLDFMIVSGALRDGNGLSYIGSTSARFSTTTWNDPNHSFRVWGNDGSSFNSMLRTTGNTMVGPVLAQALIDTANNLGHLPVYLDLLVPAKVNTQGVSTIDFGTVELGETAGRTVQVGNGADSARFSRAGTGAGIDDLDYSLSATSGFSVPSGQFSELAGSLGGAPNAHLILMDTSTIGAKSGTLTISSDDPDEPTRVIQLSGVVITPPPQSGACCLPDFSCQITDAAACTGLGGTFNGNGSTCSSCPPAPTGACCYPGFSCSVQTQSSCVAAGGTYNGNLTVCASCPVAPVGACCFPNQSCNILTQSSCESGGGTYRGNGVTCTAQPQTFCTPRGACCLPGGSCTITRATTCTQFGGLYRGNDTQCSVEICIIPDPTGACCIDRCTCVDLEASECSAQGGQYQGDGSECTEVGQCSAGLACPCDWNAVDGLDSQDLFDFLEGFFSGAADFNCADGTDSQDFFEFLECFFSGC